jgi:hypothetical protein
MKEFNFILNEFKTKHSEIDDYEYFERYINFLIFYELPSDLKSNYTEKHHILPRCVFPEYKDEKWNTVDLLYEDHKMVHLWIFKAINDRRYQRPLNWMMNQYKNSEENSIAAKKGWIKLKNNDEKYKKWCIKKSILMKNLSSEEQGRRANIFWNNINDEDYLKFCSDMKSYWTEDKRKQKSTDMKNFYSKDDNIKKKSEESKKLWESRDDEFRESFRKKMDFINKDEQKRKDAGGKIKNKWTTEEYLNKMKERKHREGKKLKLINIDGDEIIFDTMKKFTDLYNFSAHLIRKYRNTDICISDRHLNESNDILKGCKIITFD